MQHKSWRAGLVTLVVATCASPSAFAVEVLVDWTSDTEGTFSTGGNVVISTIGGNSTRFDLNNPVFPPGVFTGPVSTTEAIEILGLPATPTYTFTFSVPVSGLVMHFFSLGSTLTFDRDVSMLSSDGTLVVAGNTVKGFVRGSEDSNGSVLIGDVTGSFNFTAFIDPNVARVDGIGIQMYRGYVATPPPVPEPAAAWLVGAGLLGLLGFARRRQNTGEA